MKVEEICARTQINTNRSVIKMARKSLKLGVKFEDFIQVMEKAQEEIEAKFIKNHGEGRRVK